MAHCSISPATVFVSKAGDWKLGGLDIVADNSSIRSYDLSTLHCLPTSYRPPEIVKGNISAFSGGPLYSIDSWLLACFMYEVFNGTLSAPNQLTRTARIPQSLLPEYKRLLATQPQQRLSAQTILSSAYFKSDFVQCMEFLDNLTLKSNAEKENFFKAFESRIPTFPDVRRRRNRPRSSRFGYGNV